MGDHNIVASAVINFVVDLGGADETRTRDLRRDRHEFTCFKSRLEGTYIAEEKPRWQAPTATQPPAPSMTSDTAGLVGCGVLLDYRVLDARAG